MRINLKNFLIYALIGLAVFGTVAFIVVSYINNSLFTYELDGGGGETETLDGVKGDSFNLLLVCVDDVGYAAADNETAFMMLVRFDKERKEATYTAFPDNMLFENASGDSVLLEDVYKNESRERLTDEIHALTGITVDYYAVFTTGFVGRLVDEFGAINFNVPCDMSFYDGVSLGRGMQSVGSTAAKHIVAYDDYDSSSDARYKTARSFVSALISKVLDAKNRSQQTKLAELLSSVETNILPADVTDGAELLYSYSHLTPKAISVLGEYQSNESDSYYIVDVEETLKLFSDYRKIYK